MSKIELTRTQLGWIAQALRNNIIQIKKEIDAADDGSPIVALGEVILDGRQNLLTMIEDLENGTQKTVTIK